MVLLVFVGIEKEEDEKKANRLLERSLGYRVFSDGQGLMNFSLVDIKGGLLGVPQFTLAADTRQGMRPGFSRAASPILSRHLFDHLTHRAHSLHTTVASGRFGADIQVSLTNDGPVT